MNETNNETFSVAVRSALLLLLRIPQIAAAGAIALGLLVLTGWEFDIEGLKRLMPHFVAMNPATAVGMIMGGVALTIYTRFPASSKRAMQVARGLAIGVGVLGAAKLVAYVGGHDLGLDRILFNSQLATGGPTQGGAILVNRMALNTAILFLLTGAALFGAHTERTWLRRASKIVALITALAAVVAAIGYFNGVTSLYRPTALIPIALHTVLGFLMLSAGILTLDMEKNARGKGNDAEALGRPEALPLENKITIGFGAALFLLAVIGVVSYASIANFSASSRLTEHSRQVTTAIADCSMLMADAESGARGYVITGDDPVLEPYRSAASATAGHLAVLASLTSDNVEQKQLLGKLTPLVEGHLSFLERMIEVRKSGGADAALALIASGEGRRNMDGIRQTLATMRKMEDGRQEARSHETAESSRITSIVISLGGLLAFVLVGISGWVIQRDLLHRRRLMEELRGVRQLAIDANESKSRFLANMSHEIRTPMAAIIGFADLILQPEQTASDRLDYINTIRRNGEHLLTIINDVLDLSKIEAGKFEIERIDICPCKVLSDVASLMRVRAVEKLIRLEVKNEGVVPATIRTDPARLRQILINLVGNAIKFTEEGWVRLIMRLEEPEAGPARLRFDVIDTGIGMSREQVGKLFQPFVQADGSTTRRFGGTGLGLTISKRMAEMLGGQIEVDSSPGRGSTFSLTIDAGPLDGVRRLQNCREALAGVEKQDETQIALKGRILLVDDGPDNRRLLSVYLREAGAEVNLAENGRIGCDEALAAQANGEPFGVILMDMQMPELDGYGATAKLRSKGYKGTVIALTAHAMAEDRAKCLNAGCTDYLSKPVRRSDLLEMVARYLNAAAVPAIETEKPAIDAPPPTPTPTAEVPADKTATIRSDLNDEGLREFLVTYVGELPGRISELESCLATQELDKLSAKVHNLRGTGGMYGLMPITHAAARVEELISRQATVDAIDHEVQKLIAVIRRVEGFDAAKSAGDAQTTGNA